MSQDGVVIRSLTDALYAAETDQQPFLVYLIAIGLEEACEIRDGRLATLRPNRFPLRSVALRTSPASRMPRRALLTRLVKSARYFPVPRVLADR